ncbi:MAG: acriflavin resistance protein [Acidimicrobiales bacterium]|nr:acriflavin resistance protein [Acidimicrobiales bacterium]
MVRACLQRRRTVLVVALALLAAGAWQLPHAEEDVLPELAPPTVEIQTEALGLSAQEVEQLVTVPLEHNFLNGMPFLDTIRSRSVPGLCSVVLVFKRGTDLFTARQLVQERLSLTSELPNVSKPPQMLQAVSSASRVMSIGLTSRRVSSIQMSVLAKFAIRPRLLGVPGVANVSLFGQRDLQLQVQVDPRKLQANHVSLDQVITTTGNALFVSPLTFLEASTPGSGGFFDTPNQRLQVQHILPIRSPSDLAKIAVAETSSRLRLSDVATVVQDHQPLIGDASVKAGPGLVMVVEKLPGANTLEVTKAVNDALDGLAPGLAGIDVDRSVFQPAAYVRHASHNVRVLAIAGALLALAALGLALFDWRAALVGFTTAALSLTVAALVLYLRGVTFDALVVAGLALGVGLALHDAVVVTAAALWPRSRGGAAADGTAEDAVISLSRPLGYATLIGLVALVPVLFLAGLPSRPFLPPIAVAAALALGASCLVTLAVAPALSALLLAVRPRRGHRAEVAPAPVRGVERVTGAVLLRVARRPLLAVGVVVLLAAAGVASAARLTPGLRPSLQETDLVVRLDAPPGTSLDEVNRVLGRAAGELRAVRGVRAVGAEAGRAIGSDRVVSASSGELWVSLDPGADHDATVGQVNRVVAGYAGFSHQVVGYYDDRIEQVEGPSHEPVVVRISGDDPDVLRAKAAEVRALLTHVRGVVAPHIEVQPEQPTIQVEVDLKAAERQGLKPGDVRRAASTMVSGLEVGSLYEDQKVFQVVVVGAPAERQSLTSVQNLRIDTPSGATVRLGDVAHVTIGRGLSVIKHEDVSRSIDVSAGVAGRDVGSAVAEVQDRMGDVRFPIGHSAKVLGDYHAQGRAHRSVALAGLIVAAFVFLLLQAALESWWLALVAFGTLPLTLAGAAAAAWLDGGRLSLGSLVGFVAVGFVAVRASTIVLAGVSELDADDPATIRRTVAARAAPVIAAAIVTAAALVPLVVVGLRPGTEILRPMAVVVLGGLVTSIPVTVIVGPAAWLALGRLRRRRRAVAPDSHPVEVAHAVP